MNIKSIFGVVCTGLAIISFNASAATNFSFTGTFSADDDVQLFNFTVAGPSTVSLLSYGYGGGTQQDVNANVVLAGGFDPILALFDNTGLLIATNDDDTSGTVNADPITTFEWDTFLTTDLLAGDYIVAVMQYDNRPGTNTIGATLLSDGFKYTDDPFFTAVLGGCSNGQFCDTGGNNRTNEWAFDVLNVESATQVVPVPAAAWLFGSGLIALVGIARRK